MIEPAEAWARIAAHVAPLSAERVLLDAAQGRFLASPLLARRDDPPFDNSAMDGYAVRAEDVAGASAEHPVALALIDESRAGAAATRRLEPGQAIRIFTGAVMPAGADTVVMQEDTRRERDGEVLVLEGHGPGHHVRARGEAVAGGATILDVGDSIGPGEIALAASQGHAVVPVHRRPRVAILPTGDELLELGAPPTEGAIYDSNTHGLAAAIREAGGVPQILPRGVDTPEALEALVREGLRADVLVSTGGVSVGDYDLVHGAFAAAGVEEVFWKVRIKPGKPIRVGVAANGALAVGLPGNPVSALVTFEAFVRPAMRILVGDPLPHRPRIRVRLARPLRAPETRTELFRARLEGDVAHPARTGSSADMTSLVGLDALVILPTGAGEVTEADAIDVRGGRGARVSPWEA